MCKWFVSSCRLLREISACLFRNPSSQAHRRRPRTASAKIRYFTAPRSLGAAHEQLDGCAPPIRETLRINISRELRLNALNSTFRGMRESIALPLPTNHPKKRSSHRHQALEICLFFSLAIFFSLMDSRRKHATPTSPHTSHTDIYTDTVPPSPSPWCSRAA